MSRESEVESTSVAEASKGSRFITIRQIRDLPNFAYLSAHLGGRKVVWIQPADRLHDGAANALLKVLEEPPADTFFILVADRWRGLLPTLVSRCFALALPVPTNDEAAAWLSSQQNHDPQLALAQAGGAPLRAAALDQKHLWQWRREVLSQLGQPTADLIAMAEKMDGETLARLCHLLWGWCYDLLLLRLTGKIRYNPDFTKIAQALTVNVAVSSLLQLNKSLNLALHTLDHPLNARLVAESLLLRYRHAVLSAT